MEDVKDKNVFIPSYPEEITFRLQEKKKFKTILSAVIEKMLEEDLSQFFYFCMDNQYF